ncbi:radical SAM protein [Ruminococcus sp. Marseille-P6503]|uniref:elongator complex protein 3 n=1 Tax=Ruminococcus sp. Marseille-P6503 TaxID=2364796 RepID=UPI000F52CD3D|nr:radical SAM protein [Ruminococcus sp. Marseille-P6503]
MPHSNISIFIPHVGCPHMCAFCNQRTISGEQDIPRAEDVIRICSQALNEVSDLNNSEIAFFGGSFTAIEREYMLELLEAAHEFVGAGKFKGIRISTRPDYIDGEILDILRHYGVTAIELGAQSMRNHVLKANERGHTAEDVYRASELIKKRGFELGLQIMTGLYRSKYADDLKTMYRVIKIAPSTVRIYPTVILKGTKLAELYDEGLYKPISFERMIELCARMLEEFDANNIRVIRCGLHSSDNIKGSKVGGFYHPAFKELCESEIFRRKIETEILKSNLNKTVWECVKSRFKPYVIAVNPLSISKAVGHKKCNSEYFGNSVRFVADEKLSKYECELRG